MILVASLVIQGCSLFDSTPNCNQKKVKESVKKLYASQVNPHPITNLDLYRQQSNPHIQNMNIDLQSTIGIDLVNIKTIDVEQLKNKPNKTEDDEQTLSMIESLDGAKYICEAVIEHQLYGDNIESLVQEIGDEAKSFIQHKQLKLPVLYAIHHEDGSDQYEVSYSLKNRVQGFYAMMLVQAENAKNDALRSSLNLDDAELTDELSSSSAE